MKTKLGILIFLLAAVTLPAQTTNLTSLLQQGLMEEQANRNIDAAITDYQTLAGQFDKYRQIAATAIFRLGECYRAQGKTNEAVLQYQRILRDFSDQQPLATLSRQNLTALGTAPVNTPPRLANSGGSLDALQSQYALLKAQIEQAGKETNIEFFAELFSDAKDLVEKMRTPAAFIPLYENMLQDAKANGSKQQIEAAEASLQEAEKPVEKIRQEIIEYEHLRLKTIQSAMQQYQTTDVAQIGNEAVIPPNDEDQEIENYRQMIKNSPDLINASPNSGAYPPLINAAVSGHLRTTQFLLENGADVNLSHLGRTALSMAAGYGHKAMVELLLQHGADVNAVNGSPLDEAATHGFQAVAEVLLNHHADVNAGAKGGKTPLIVAAEHGQTAMVRMLLAANADPNIKGEQGETPLSMAIWNMSPETVKVLLAAGANPNIQNDNKRTDLSFAIEQKLPEVVEMLLKAKADPNAGEQGKTPLYLAVTKNDFPMVKLLLQFKADPNAPQPGDSHLLSFCFASTNILDSLLDAGAVVDPLSKDEYHWTPLCLACSMNFTRAVETLLKHHADPNVRVSGGMTPLHWAANSQSPQEKTFALLLAAKANPNVQNNDGKTPLDELRQKLVSSDTSPEIKQSISRIIELLHQHGALDTLPNWNTISVSRPSSHFSTVVFRNGTNDWNQFTLMQTLFNFYEHIQFENFAPGPMFHQEGSTSGFKIFENGKNGNGPRENEGVFPYGLQSKLIMRTSRGSTNLLFPDLAHLTIVRPDHNSTNQTRITVNIIDSSNGVSCSKDQSLKFGDVVEIPELDHALGDTPIGLTDHQRDGIFDCLNGNIELEAQGKKTMLPLLPIDGGQPTLSAMLKRNEARQLLLASSDLGHVKVTRQGHSWVLDCSGDAPYFWLQNGDVIEVPEKP